MKWTFLIIKQLSAILLNIYPLSSISNFFWFLKYIVYFETATHLCLCGPVGLIQNYLQKVSETFNLVQKLKVRALASNVIVLLQI